MSLAGAGGVHAVGQSAGAPQPAARWPLTSREYRVL